MNKKQYIYIIIFCLFTLFITNETSLAKFRGGTVYDLKRLVKEKILSAHEKDKTSKITKNTDLLEEYSSKLETIKLSSFLKKISSFEIFSSKTNGLLNTNENIDEKLEIATTIDFLTGQKGNTPDAWKNAREENNKRFLNENNITVTRANQVDEFNETSIDQIQKILSDYSKGVLSEQQKNLLLKSMAAQSKNVTALMDSQSNIAETSKYLYDRKNSKIAEAYTQYHQYDVPNNDETYQNRIKKHRIENLPIAD